MTEVRYGRYGCYYWLVSSEQISSLDCFVITHHLDKTLAITCFDSGPLTPTLLEQQIGWHYRNEIMYSPPLTEGIDIPSDQYDEWYIGSGLAFPSGGIETFVNYGGFTLVPPEELYKSYDPSCEKGVLDSLEVIQSRFWKQLERINPETFIAVGDNDVVVTKSQQFFDEMISHVQADDRDA